MKNVKFDLKEALWRHKLNQKELTEKLNERFGSEEKPVVSAGTISHICNGRIKQIPIDLLGQIMDVLKIDDVRELIVVEDVEE